MDRREFLKRMAVFAAASMFSNKLLGWDIIAKANNDVLNGIHIIDAHAHPDMDHSCWPDKSASYEYMKDTGKVSSIYSAIGDLARFGGMNYSDYEFTKRQLNWWLNGVVANNNVSLVLKASDIPNGGAPGAILGIEGGDSLEGNPERIQEFYKMGVRLITLIHYYNNEIGDTMKPLKGRNPGPYSGGLSSIGRDVISKMEEHGMVVDGAHAHPSTLKDIISFVTKPVIDSHTNPCQINGIATGRMRSWDEMEMIAKTGGVVCTWPMKLSEIPRQTFKDWANEILLMKRYLGIEHVGLGTDGGGNNNSYSLVDGYYDVRDLGSLAEAMLEVGLSQGDIKAYMGGNVMRVLNNCLAA